MAPKVTDASLRPIIEKVLAGTRLDCDDGLALFATRDLAGVWALADFARHRAVGPVAYYAINGHINYSNYCVHSCAFCGFRRSKPSDAPAGPGASPSSGDRAEAVGGYEMTVAEAGEQAERIAAGGATEIHIVGGLHPDFPLGYYVGLVSEVRRRCPRATIKAFTAVEIRHIAAKAGAPVREVLLRLREAGLGMLPGGGAEILVDRVRRRICPQKETSAEWLATHREAHGIGLRSTATMLFGHIESQADRVEHLLSLRELQDGTGGFLAFVPLPYQPVKGREEVGAGPGAADILRTVGVSRLLLDNFRHIKAYWVAFGLGVAQTALSCGADDLDGTVLQEKVFHAAGAQTPQGLSIGELRRAIEETGRTPVERDAEYRAVIRGGRVPSDWRVLDP